jgi:hypothetical protein
MALGEPEVAGLAHIHLRDYAQIVMTLHNLTPTAVVRFLQQEGLPASEDRLEEIARNIEEVWRGQSSGIVNPHAASV